MPQCVICQDWSYVIRAIVVPGKAAIYVPCRFCPQEGVVGREG